MTSQHRRSGCSRKSRQNAPAGLVPSSRSWPSSRRARPGLWISSYDEITSDIFEILDQSLLSVQGARREEAGRLNANSATAVSSSGGRPEIGRTSGRESGGQDVRGPAEGRTNTNK